MNNSSHFDYSKDQNGQVKETNFIPNDSIRTEYVLNWNNSWNPDYLLVIENDEIVSRWYVIESVRTCSKQYQLTLKRDTVADRYDNIMISPIFVEKGFVRNESPLIFNKEDFTCNQIKQNECLIKDQSNCSWIVLYYSIKDKVELKGQISTIEEPYVDIGTTLASWSLYTYIQNGYKSPTSKSVGIKISSRSTAQDYLSVWNTGLVYFDTFERVSSNNPYNRSTKQPIANQYSLKYKWGTNLNNPTEATSAVINLVIDSVLTLNSKLEDYAEPSTTLENFLNWNGKLIKTSDNKFYRISIQSNGTDSESTTLSSGELYDSLCNIFKTGGDFKPDWSGNFDDTFSATVQYNKYSITATPVTNGVTTYNFDFSSIRDTQDSPYGIICFPYKNMDEYGRPMAADLDILNPELGLLIARKLCEKGVGSAGPVYDVQLLPYCPLNVRGYTRVDMIDLLLSIDLNANDYLKIRDTNNVVGTVALFPISASFTKTVDKWQEILFSGMRCEYYPNSNIPNLKVENQCTFYRLVSPNYSGQFEFSRAKMLNDIDVFSIDCTYKPFQPYIHVTPIFKGLYGADFDDARGLICSGDFSFGAVTSAFEQYKLQNKNYQDIFNREIESMDTNYSINQKYNLIRTIEGEIGSGAAMLGGASMGHPAAALGGAIGLIGTAATGLTSYAQNKELYKEARDVKIDMHNYALENIKAIPNSLAKVDAYNLNNKIFPFLERYSCTDEEKEIFKNKIKYEGMTVNALGKIEDYINNDEEETFIKGRFYRLLDINEEAHFAQDIYDEVARGIYFRR